MKERNLFWVVLIFLTITIICFCSSAYSETGGVSGNITWVLDDDGVLIISGIGDMPNYNSPYITHPWEDNITSVVIENGVTSIGNCAFSNCANLSSVTIPSSVTNISNYAFDQCSSLENISIPDSVIRIGAYAFARCNLSSVNIPDGVSYIGDGAFSNCVRYAKYGSNAAKALGKALYSFREPDWNFDLMYEFLDQEILSIQLCSVDKDAVIVSVPEGVKRIGESAFSDCKILTDVILPDSITSIAGKAFYNCYRLKNINIPDNVTSIAPYAFYYCQSLKSVIIPESVKNVGRYAFSYCSGLISVKIPKTLTKIDEQAFSYCTNLKSITIPEGVTELSKRAFKGCTNLKKMVIPRSVTIFDDSFVNSAPTIYCYKYSEIDNWIQKNGNRLKVEYLDNWPSSRRELSMEKNLDLAIGNTHYLTYNIFPDHDNPVVSWTSSDPTIVSVVDGEVTALSEGSAVITAMCDQITASVRITTYIAASDFELIPAEEWIVARTEKCQLSIINLVPYNSKASVVWNSSDTDLATVNDDGLVNTIMPGDVIISATSELGTRHSSLLHICYPVTSVSLVAPRSVLLNGSSMAIIAEVTMSSQNCTNHLVKFTSDDESIATVDEKTGIVYGVSPGKVIISATSASGQTDSIEITVIDVCVEHIPEIDVSIAPTCSSSGLSEGSHCAVCGNILIPQETIDALGHIWSNASYSWSDDNTLLTASRICSRDDTHIEIETVSTIRVATLSPTESDTGTYKFSSNAFENDAFTVQYTDGGIIPALGTLRVLRLPLSLTTIEEEAFENLNCQAVIIPINCKSIKNRAFFNCNDLVYVLIPDSIDELAPNAFEGCPNIIIDRKE